jgi:hypothetical protein
MSETPTTEPTDDGAPGRDTPTINGGPTVSLGEAVRTTGKAKSTLQRRLAEGAIPGAVRLPSGGWSIPISGLIAAGLEPRMSPAHTPMRSPMKRAPIRTFRGGPNIDPEADEVFPEIYPEVYAIPLSANEVAELRAELERANAREAAARDRAELLEANVHDLRQALEALSRALPPGPQPPAVTVSQAPRRRWWSSK